MANFISTFYENMQKILKQKYFVWAFHRVSKYLNSWRMIGCFLEHGAEFCFKIPTIHQSDVSIRCSKGKALPSPVTVVAWTAMGNLSGRQQLCCHLIIYLCSRLVLPLGEGGRPEVCRTPSFPQMHDGCFCTIINELLQNVWHFARRSFDLRR